MFALLDEDGSGDLDYEEFMDAFVQVHHIVSISITLLLHYCITILFYDCDYISMLLLVSSLFLLLCVLLVVVLLLILFVL